jgi:hypothetical protein
MKPKSKTVVSPHGSTSNGSNIVSIAQPLVFQETKSACCISSVDHLDYLLWKSVQRTLQPG